MKKMYTNPATMLAGALGFLTATGVAMTPDTAYAGSPKLTAEQREHRGADTTIYTVKPGDNLHKIVERHLESNCDVKVGDCKKSLGPIVKQVGAYNLDVMSKIARENKGTAVGREAAEVYDRWDTDSHVYKVGEDCTIEERLQNSKDGILMDDLRAGDRVIIPDYICTKVYDNPEDPSCPITPVTPQTPVKPKPQPKPKPTPQPEEPACPTYECPQPCPTYECPTPSAPITPIPLDPRPEEPKPEPKKPSGTVELGPGKVTPVDEDTTDDIVPYYPDFSMGAFGWHARQGLQGLGAGDQYIPKYKIDNGGGVEGSFRIRAGDDKQHWVYFEPRVQHLRGTRQTDGLATNNRTDISLGIAYQHMWNAGDWNIGFGPRADFGFRNARNVQAYDLDGDGQFSKTDNPDTNEVLIDTNMYGGLVWGGLQFEAEGPLFYSRLVGQVGTGKVSPFQASAPFLAQAYGDVGMHFFPVGTGSKLEVTVNEDGTETKKHVERKGIVPLKFGVRGLVGRESYTTQAPVDNNNPDPSVGEMGPAEVLNQRNLFKVGPVLGIETGNHFDKVNFSVDFAWLFQHFEKEGVSNTGPMRLNWNPQLTFKLRWK